MNERRFNRRFVHSLRKIGNFIEIDSDFNVLKKIVEKPIIENFESGDAELKKVKGVGDHTAVFLRMLPAVLGRYQGARTRLSAIINSPEEAYAWLEPYFFGARNEMVYVLCLDGKRQVLGVRKVAEGSIEMAEVNTRRIAEEAIGLRAAQIYVAHNHVSNLAIPSQADWLTTDTLRGALRPIGIELIDHLVFVDGDMVSLKDSEHLKGLQYV